MNTRESNRKCGYHHGDLRNALILAAAELIEEKGSTEFSMVEAARRAGVSNAAPYRHFRDRDDLLQAVALLGFYALGQSTGAVADRYPEGSRESIIEQGKAYLTFVQEHKAFYGLMFGDHDPQAPSSERPETMARGFYRLVEAVQSWCEAEGLRDQDPLQLAVKLWANVHGLAVLAVHQQIGKFIPDADVFDLLEGSCNTFLDGLLQGR